MRAALGSAVENPLRALRVFGQSVWLDYVRRSLFTSGELRRLIDDDGVQGVTSNPAIFEKAIAGSSEYDDMLGAAAARSHDAASLYERLAVRDIQCAADALASVYDATSMRDGYVSLEVSPLVAHDAAATVEEARRLWRAVNRPNLMIKVPATADGVRAVRRLIGEGINVNATLLFTRDVYEQVAEAYIAGLETLADKNGSLAGVAGVASFFVSRIDTAIDARIAARLETATGAEASMLRGLVGRVAIANAKLTFQRYRELFDTPRWRALARRGAQTQRLLWASTGTKNPSFRDVVYVEELIGPETVNTMPPATLDAFRDHGRPRASLADDLDSARDTMASLAEAGMSIAQIGDGLLAEGLRLFTEAFAKLLKAVKRPMHQPAAARTYRGAYTLPEPLASAVAASLDEWREGGNIRRLWTRDASLWSGKDEAQWLGWLGVTNGQLAHIHRFTYIATAARNAGFTNAVLFGMGGSSLCPDVMKTTFGKARGFPRLHVLDSTDPAQVKAIEDAVELKRTIFIVASKSGSTLEPDLFRRYFFDRLVTLVGAAEAGRRFIAITDPGSALQHVAERDGFRRVFAGWPTIGGRFSALSDFGLVPAAVMGVDVATFLERAEAMVCACMPSVPLEENPGVVLGTILGVAAAEAGRDKVTIVASPRISTLGAWLEQLVAESTGKDGKGLVPVDGETPGAPDSYGSDRVFVYLRLASAPDASQEAAVDALARHGHPVVRLTLNDAYDLGAEFFRWEIATAVAGSILGINPFDQPDVEASKTAARKLTDEYERTGRLPAEAPIFTADGIALFADGANAAALEPTNAAPSSLPIILRRHLDRIRPGDYFALLPFLEMNPAHQRALQAIRHRVRDAKRVATCLEFGPRFLHSTGQLYKGGPNTGVFLQITCGDAADLPVPGRSYSFGVVKAAQARGDVQVLADRHRRVLRVHISGDVAEGLQTLHAGISAAVGPVRSS